MKRILFGREVVRGGFRVLDCPFIWYFHLAWYPSLIWWSSYWKHEWAILVHYLSIRRVENSSDSPWFQAHKICWPRNLTWIFQTTIGYCIHFHDLLRRMNLYIGVAIGHLMGAKFPGGSYIISSVSQLVSLSQKFSYFHH